MSARKKKDEGIQEKHYALEVNGFGDDPLGKNKAISLTDRLRREGYNVTLNISDYPMPADEPEE